ncbi:hypothetical protein BTH42_05575 [Burkholderia sp. SRS-W-2-2016]|uniref:AbiU2 domain-containing protein n=1 Tax=Burkholderia sp. SRS-W-2-2016 TaxID=1926878 RepID=UPI00094AFB64|nr:hypothetical protein [Burkholderia sp. SRS-W-2-2016]OLL32693.1 hypothetical protein BTH42_05575 [Burkholderia sp. SRS-W-2-2016]
MSASSTEEQKMKELRELLSRIADSVNAARAHYQIWFMLRGEGKALPEYYQDMNDHRYVDFFHASNAGHYKLMFIELGCLFDPDLRAASMRNLKIALALAGRKDIVRTIDASLAEYKDLVSGILTIRSKLIAHKDIGAKSKDVHAQSKIVPNEVEKLINVCSELIGRISAEIFGVGNTLAAVTDRFERATLELLNVLRKGRTCARSE